MPNEDKTLLRQLNPFLDLSFSNISIDNSDYHATAAWPVNIMAMVLKNDGQGRDYYENLVENQHLPILVNHVYFIPCGLKMRFEESSASSVISLHFNLTFFHGIDIFSGITHCEMRHDPEMVARFHSLLNEEKDELKTICALKMEVMRFCLSCWPTGLDRLTPLIRKYESVFRFVREHGDATLAVKDLAKLVGQRENVFSRNFSRDIGKSPKQFLQSDLLKRIVTYLLVPQMSVKETAANLKFSSEFYMSRFFKKHTGLSPSEYQSKFRR
jgi:AraC-like DNA-binding protein